jgi:hypothetical protein
MDSATDKLVRERAANRCEYCHMRQEDEPFYRLHIEHIIARQHAGSDDASNLALSCHHCNLHKGPNLSAIDPMTSQVVLLFHPRRQTWAEHFFVQGHAIRGMTPVGRATVRLLAMNAVARMELRVAAGVKPG